jgi:hypothetical protein
LDVVGLDSGRQPDQMAPRELHQMLSGRIRRSRSISR